MKRLSKADACKRKGALRALLFCMKKSPTLVRMRNEAPQRGGLDRVYYMRISGARQAQIFVTSAALRRGSFRAFVCGRALDKVLAEQSGNALLLLDDSGIGTLGGKLLHLIRRDGEDGTNGALIAHAASLLSPSGVRTRSAIPALQLLVNDPAHEGFKRRNQLRMFCRDGSSCLDLLHALW